MWWFYLVMTQQTLNLSLGVCETPREWIVEGLVAKTAERKVSDTRVIEGTLIHRAVFLCVCLCTCVHTIGRVWRLEENFQGFVLSFRHRGCRNWTQFARLDCLCLLSHLVAYEMLSKNYYYYSFFSGITNTLFSLFSWLLFLLFLRCSLLPLLCSGVEDPLLPSVFI